MVNYHIHSNGWTVVLDNFNFKTATQEDADTIAWLLGKYTVVMANNREHINSLTTEDEVRFCAMMGTIDDFTERRKQPKIYKSMIVKENPLIARVTGEPDPETGYYGLFGHDEELDWHVNRPQDRGRSPLVWLRSVKGAKGSRTSWFNTIPAWEDLQKEDPEFAQYLIDGKFKVIPGFRTTLAEGGHSDYFAYFSDQLPANNWYPHMARNLIFTNEAGQTGLFMPRLQLGGIIGMPDSESAPLLDKLYAYCTQEKYIYHHDWEDSGEVVIAEQWLSVHKRFAFDGMKTRLLHRVAFDYRNTTWFKELPTEQQEHFLSL